MNTELNLRRLQEELRKKGLKAYYIVTSDPHNSEYVADYFLAERLYFCPFTGSDGNLLVTHDSAYLFTDGRYFIQAEKELSGSSVKLMKLSTPGYPSLPEFVKSEGLFPLGLNEMRVTESEARSLADDLSDLVDVDFGYLIENRPSLPKSPIWELSSDLTSLSRSQKIDFVRDFLRKIHAEGHLITTLNDICYLLNIRGDDIPCTPVAMSFLYLDYSAIHLFIDRKKVPDGLLKDVTVQDYDEIVDFLKSCQGRKILLDTQQVNLKLSKLITDPIPGPNPSVMMKAIKGPVEIANSRRTHILDGVAMVKFIKYLHEHLDDGLTEYQLAQILEGFRRENPSCFELSFASIVAVGSNAAEMHYDPKEDNSAVVTAKENVLLVDSGGQYYGGTTDITRTFILHQPTAELIHDYTLTLKSVIDLSMTIFLKGCSGRSLDIKARENMWRESMDYKCGTGHGVGYMLGVHEGPNGFRYKTVRERDDGCVLQEGMITTVEPGVYKAGKYGIRIENELLTIPHAQVEGDEYMAFESITCCPIETKYLDMSILTDDEIKYLNNYHAWVYDTLSKHFDDNMNKFIKGLCQPINR